MVPKGIQRGPRWVEPPVGPLLRGPVVAHSSSTLPETWRGSSLAPDPLGDLGFCYRHAAEPGEGGLPCGPGRYMGWDPGEVAKILAVTGEDTGAWVVTRASLPVPQLPLEEACRSSCPSSGLFPATLIPLLTFFCGETKNTGRNSAGDFNSCSIHVEICSGLGPAQATLLGGATSGASVGPVEGQPGPWPVLAAHRMSWGHTGCPGGTPDVRGHTGGPGVIRPQDAG